MNKLSRFLSFLLCILSVISTSTQNGKKILVFSQHDGVSHWGSMMFTMNSLADAGYNLTLIRTTSKESWRPFSPKFNHVDLFVPHETLPEKGSPDFWHKRKRGYDLVSQSTWAESPAIRVLETHKEKRSQILEESWDLVLVDYIFVPLGNAVARYLKEKKGTPYLFLSTGVMLFTEYESMALGRNPVSRMTSFPRQPSDPYEEYDASKFFDRLDNLIDTVGQWASLRLLLPFLQPKAHPLLAGGNIDWSKLYRESSGFVLEDPHKFGYPMPESFDMTRIGYHCPPQATALPEKFASFIEDVNSKGTIYVAFGTMVKWDEAPEFVEKSFKDVLLEFTGYRIIFVGSNGWKETSENHILHVPFAPQKEILNHPQTKLFITHGGLKSIKEAVCSSTPLVVMPILAEQNLNARIAKEFGIAEVVDKLTVNAESLRTKVRNVLENSKYTEAMEEFRSVYLNNVVDQSNLVVHTVERAIKVKNMEKWKRKGMMLTWNEHLYTSLIVIISIFTGFLCKENFYDF